MKCLLNMLDDSLDNRSSDEEVGSKTKIKKRLKRFSVSESDSGNEITQNGKISELDKEAKLQKSSFKSSDSDSGPDIIIKSKRTKSRIRRDKNDTDSDDPGSESAVKNEEQQLRMKNKRNKLHDKFKSLVTAREKEPSPTNNEPENDLSNNDISNSSDDEIGSIEKIKQKIKESMSFKPSICDPDTSDEENIPNKSTFKQKNERKKMKTTSPKPQRMSAKQAMENMQKIKSESNRMLREKEVSLPYHRPKALSLKDVLNRRKPAISADGKAFPIKMNEQQLKQYAKMLEERQKEMMELCKSESEEEESENINGHNQETISVNESKPEELASIINTDKLSGSDTENTNNPNENENKNDENKLQEENRSLSEDADITTREQDSESSMQLVYNESANSEDGKLTAKDETGENFEKTNGETSPKHCNDVTIPEKEVCEKRDNTEQTYTSLNKNTEGDTQLISLHFDSQQSTKAINKEQLIKGTEPINKETSSGSITTESATATINEEVENPGMEVENEFSDDEINMGDIDSIIENAEIIKDIEDKVNSQMLIRNKPLNINPKLTGKPGMVIDLDVDDSAPRKSGVELLKERFTYFSKLKTPEELEREREKRIIPGAQLKKLKQELEEKIAEQRSLEWAKRREEDEQQQKELKILRGEESDEDDIDKLDAEVENKEMKEKAEKSDSEEELGEEEELIQDDIEMKDKIKPRNAMVDDEAEESDCDDQNLEENEQQNDKNYCEDGDNEEENSSESDESEDSSESEDEQPSTLRKGRILKAFEDSDDENSKNENKSVITIKDAEETTKAKTDSSEIENAVQSQVVSQDEELQLAQIDKTVSDDLFTSQESALIASEAKDKSMDTSENNEAFTQTFSILESSKQGTVEVDLNNSGKLSAVSDTQPLEAKNIDNIELLCPLSDSQKELPMPSQIPMSVSSQSQAFGEDVLALCTGQFYNNEFVSQLDDKQKPLSASINYDAFDNLDSQEIQLEKKEDSISDCADIVQDKTNDTNVLKETDHFIELNPTKNKENVVDDNLKSILDELDDPEYDSPKPNKFFTGGKNSQKENNESLVKKKLIIDSDDETTPEETDVKKRKKLKKKKAEKRTLQISDDEEEELEQEEIEEYESDIEEETTDRLVEYDSEENEIEVKPQSVKKKRKGADFLENEAELTSEDEWVGSGDEDEAGLDRMEREAGDDDTFHQGELQRELGQIHMRDVLDQDKREVRIIQELLFEDGDLGAGGRQRKFRWNNIDGDEEMGTVPDEFVDTQEEEFESEEQWRKQRHEREMFLRQMREKEDPEESLNVSINRTTLIKANLNTKPTSNSLLEVNTVHVEKTEITEKKTARDIPSPKKPFPLMQQSHQGSLLFRGRSSLARLAALATPLAADDDKLTTLNHGNRRNFVFTAIAEDEVEPKVSKRKADSNPATPKLVKKMRTEENNAPKISLLDHLKV